MSNIITRFAPSPTGHLHVGNVRAALFGYLFAKAAGGRYMLRLDDTDTERSTEEYARGIETDLAWLGLPHDIFARQSDRFAQYEAAAALPSSRPMAVFIPATKPRTSLTASANASSR